MLRIPLLKRAVGSRRCHIVNKTGNVHTYNIDSRSCNHCCSGKSISITYSECVSVNLVTQHAMRMHHFVIFGLPGCAVRGAFKL